MILMLSLLVVGATACSKSSAGGAGGTGGGTEELTIPKAGNLKVTAPKGSKVEDLMGDPAVKFPDSSMITFAKPSAIQEADLDAAIKDAKSSYQGSSSYKKEKLANGWIFSYVNKAPIGTMYMVSARLKFGDKIWMCSANVNSEAQQTTAYNACKSLKL
jgi:hypothetical protein